ncbi:hypothetical protein AB0E08_10935 [Streptomyces sp. NPDC048281]|uniref:hypothetical protein n=1 Tax=Streptomyces sp. NPDC048281 TaxID=3154715 RepID=UPI0034209763
MTGPSLVLGEPLDLPLPEAWPKPHPRCRACAQLAKERLEAQAEGDYSKVSDANVELRRHASPHRRRQP